MLRQEGQEAEYDAVALWRSFAVVGEDREFRRRELQLAALQLDVAVALVADSETRVPALAPTGDERRDDAAAIAALEILEEAARRGDPLAAEDAAAALAAVAPRAGVVQGSKRERNSQLQRLRSRPFSTRFG